MKKRLDYGSGHNPKKGWCTSDPWSYTADYAVDPVSYRVECEDDEFSFVRLRNVLHHVMNLEKLVDELSRITEKVITIDVNEENYARNFFLDRLWYRFIIPRHEVWFSDVYRDPRPVFLRSFYLIREKRVNEKEVLLWKKA